MEQTTDTDDVHTLARASEPVYVALKAFGLYSDLISRYTKKQKKVVTVTNALHLMYSTVLGLFILINTIKHSYGLYINSNKGISSDLASCISNVLTHLTFMLYLPVALWALSTRLDTLLEKMQEFKSKNGLTFNFPFCRKFIAVFLITIIGGNFVVTFCFGMWSETFQKFNESSPLSDTYNSLKMFDGEDMPKAVIQCWSIFHSFVNTNIVVVITTVFMFVIHFLRKFARALTENIARSTSQCITDRTLSEYRIEYLALVDLIESFDTCISFFVGTLYALGIIVPCLMMYGFVHDELSPQDLTLSSMYILHLGEHLLVYIIGGLILNNAIHRPLADLHRTKLDGLTEKGVQELSLFISRVSGSPIGVSIFGLFVIDKSTVLMLIGTLITYAVVVVQFQPTTTAGK